MPGEPSPQDVADALSLTVERYDAAGAPWCPPRDAVILRRWVSDRGAGLGGGIRRVVRLARLLAIADGRDYVRLLYVQVTALRAREFSRTLHAAAAGGRIPPEVATLSPPAVVLREATTVKRIAPGDGFEIAFAQMPLLAALLDFLHNALGFAAVADRLAPALKLVPSPGAVETVARTLHADISAWLGERLESSTHLRQAQRMRAYLSKRERLAPEAIDDEAILDFWATIAAAPDDAGTEGFKLYTSAAGAMLRYRQALRDARSARQLESSIAAGRRADDGTSELDRITTAEPTVEPWRSPLRGLLGPSASRVKWLNRKELGCLRNYLGGPVVADEQESARRMDEPIDWRDGLNGEERFDLTVVLTLLRADVFGAAQASIVARLRKRAGAGAAIGEAMAPVDDSAYATCSTGYATLREQLRLACLAALAIALEAQAHESIALLGHLGGRGAMTAVLGDAAREIVSEHDGELPADETRAAIATALKTSRTDPDSNRAEAGDLLAEARAAVRKVQRAGFRREDRNDPDMLAALRCGIFAAIDVDRELERLTARLGRGSIGDIATDRRRFHEVFCNLYRA